MSRHRGAKHCRRYGLLGTNLRAPPLRFRRRPPQSNYPPHRVPDPDNGPRLDNKRGKGGISRVAPQGLASLLQSLPPILHMPDLLPV
ncbi:unnamed protein product [Ectocarpus sp. 12 AP-2014]